MPFSRLALHADLLRGIKELGFTRPTPIQEQAIPPAASGRDLLASAMTGSGKTAAFLLPILHRVMGKPRGVTRALILTPTRELATQIHAHMEELAVHTPVSGASVFGGVGMGPQEHAFRSGADIIVATPGRLLDHLRRPYARLQGLEILVLDEADRMLDMGFLPDVRRILRHLPAKRQTLFFSATMPREIVELSRDMLHNPVTIHIERKLAPAAGITHAIYPVPRELKAALLLELLRQNTIADVIVFTRTKHRADRLAAYLGNHRIQAARIHGNRSQAQRTEALAGFKAGRHRVLVATDIVARGIDVESLGHVVNFDVPADPGAYVHRVGRTARAEATGTAFTLVSPDEEADLRGIESALGQRLPRVTLPGFDYAKKPHTALEAQGRRRGTGNGRARGHAPAGTGRRGGNGRPRRAGSSSSGGAYGRSREERIQAILDKHAPVGAAPRRKTSGRWRR
jgi:ATP-dependent RNA helicase RhlE